MDDVRARLADAGFDLVHAFDTDVVADAVPALAGRARCGLLIGNTRALWPKFTEARRDPALAADADPLDRYTERAIASALPAARLYFAHRTYDGAFLPFQRVAVATGLGALAPSHLVIHPVYGPWFALRAIAIVDEPPPPCVQIPQSQPCRCEAACTRAVAEARARPEDRDAWLAVRDACALSAYRYSEDQIRYHYDPQSRASLANREATPHDGEPPPPIDGRADPRSRS